MKILGVDPGSSRLGFGVIEKAGSKLELKNVGVIETKVKDVSLKFLTLAAEFKKLLAEANPEIIGVEKLFFTKNVKTGIEVAQARGIIMYLSLQSGAKVIEFTPQQIKQAVSGYGNTSKDGVAKMVRLLLPESRTTLKNTKLDDATDAVAVAIAAANYTKI